MKGQGSGCRSSCVGGRGLTGSTEHWGMKGKRLFMAGRGGGHREGSPSIWQGWSVCLGFLLWPSSSSLDSVFSLLSASLFVCTSLWSRPQDKWMHRYDVSLVSGCGFSVKCYSFSSPITRPNIGRTDTFTYKATDHIGISTKYVISRSHCMFTTWLSRLEALRMMVELQTGRQVSQRPQFETVFQHFF